MKIMRFRGGLGNQMFQYACYKSLEKKYPDVRADLHGFKVDTAHNGYELEDVFNVEMRKASELISSSFDVTNRKWRFRKIRRILGLKKLYIEEEKNFAFDPTIFSSSKSGYYAGFWQNERYFIDVEMEIRADFRFQPLADQQNIDIMQKITASNSVSIHIRRGDYVDHPTFGGICDKDYYLQAIKLIKSKVEAPKFFIFSNDIEWCTTNLAIEDSEFISWNTGYKSYIDMQLMAACQHNIIANSSFSWWGAWLNANPEKIIIGPQKWLHSHYDTSTLLPQDWIKI